jgi:flagellar biosynthesis chaperone FliJ
MDKPTLFEEDTTNLLAKLQASYKRSRDILQEIQLEKADLFDLSPLRTVSKESEESKKYEEVSAYCQEKQFTSSHRGVELDVFEDISSYCAEKMVLLTSVTALDIITKERDDLLTENNELRHQIEFKSSCYIQAQSSIASMMRLLKEKEDALREYDEVLKMNDDANARIVGAMTHRHNDQIVTLNKKLQKSSSNVRELECKLEAMEKNWFKFKAMTKVKDRQLESAVKMRADLEKIEKENKTKSCHIDSLSSSNNEFIDIIASLTKIINEKDQAIDDWENLYRMNDEANRKILEQKLQENSRRVTGLLNIIKRQKFGESEYLQLQLKEKAALRLEVEAMRRRLDSYDYGHQEFSDVHLIIVAVSLSSGLLLLFWSYIVSGLKNC